MIEIRTTVLELYARTDLWKSTKEPKGKVLYPLKDRLAANLCRLPKPTHVMSPSMTKAVTYFVRPALYGCKYPLSLGSEHRIYYWADPNVACLIRKKDNTDTIIYLEINGTPRLSVSSFQLGHYRPYNTPFFLETSLTPLEQEQTVGWLVFQNLHGRYR